MIDFFARWSHFADHQAPIYFALEEMAGNFYVPSAIAEHVRRLGIEPVVLEPRLRIDALNVAPGGTNPLLVAATGDLALAWKSNRSRKYILMEHGVGIVYPNNASYAGSRGPRGLASLTLAPNQHVYELTKSALPRMKQFIIGTPLLDRWAGKMNWTNTSSPPIVVISFHWDGRMVAPEAGTAFKYFQHVLPELAKSDSFRLVAHAHPRNANEMRPFYEKLGIEFWESFEQVMNEADLLVCDNSSIIYMFLVPGKPVILLNSPAYRKNIDLGIRFWKYADVGEQVDDPEQLFFAIIRALSKPGERLVERSVAIAALFPYLGYSAEMTAHYLRHFFEPEAKNALQPA